MSKIPAITKRLLSLEKDDLIDEVKCFHVISELVHKLCIEIRSLELNGVDRDVIISELNIVREIHGKSIFISRLQNWFRGYQGDFETIEYLCDGENKTIKNSIEYYLERIALSSPIAQQHKNKVFMQSNKIIDVLSSQSDRTSSVLSIGCGGCRDIRLIEPVIKNANVNLVINDIDDEASKFSENKLSTIRDKITSIHGDTYRRINKITKFGPYDLIVAGGLFDYLPDRYACKLVEKLMLMLNSNGQVCFTNILKPNPWRVWIEYLANWTLIEREERDFRYMFDTFGLVNVKLKMVPDSTNLAGFYTITK